MKLQKVILFLFALPVTLILDIILYSFTQACPSCGSFSVWLKSEGALSFPIVIGLSEWLGQYFRHSDPPAGGEESRRKV